MKAQLIGSSIVTLSTFGVALAVMYAVNLTGTLRVSEEGELYGLDLHEHGIPAYPEYVISSIGAPAGMPKEQTLHGAVTELVARFSGLPSTMGD
ncbi:MAG TPA: hypothetical protein VH479_07450 [Acidimicrobiales bacterium]